MGTATILLMLSDNSSGSSNTVRMLLVVAATMKAILYYTLKPVAMSSHAIPTIPVLHTPDSEY